MRAVFRRLLLTCLMLALPLEAFASTAMLGCAFSHQGLAQAVAAADRPCHEEQVPEAPFAAHDCAHCAACHLASVLPIPAAPGLSADAPAASPPVAVDERISGFIPDMPERPPRPFLA